MDLSINLEPTRKVFDAFEDVDKGVVAFPHVLGRLANADIITKQRERARVTRTERRMPIPENICFAGGNAWRQTMKYVDTRIEFWVRLTRLGPVLMTALVEMACSALTTGASHLINFGSPFLNSSNAWDCSLNIARIESVDSHLSSILASS